MAVVAGVTPRLVATGATQQQQDDRQLALGVHLSDHLIPALVSRDKAVAGWAVEVLLALGTAQVEQDPHSLRVGPAPDWHCLPAQPTDHC